MPAEGHFESFSRVYPVKVLSVECVVPSTSKHISAAAALAPGWLCWSLLGISHWVSKVSWQTLPFPACLAGDSGTEPCSALSQGGLSSYLEMGHCPSQPHGVLGLCAKDQVRRVTGHREASGPAQMHTGILTGCSLVPVSESHPATALK